MAECIGVSGRSVLISISTLYAVLRIGFLWCFAERLYGRNAMEPHFEVAAYSGMAEPFAGRV